MVSPLHACISWTQRTICLRFKLAYYCKPGATDLHSRNNEESLLSWTQFSSFPLGGIPQDGGGTRLLCFWVRRLHVYRHWETSRPCIRKVAYNSTETIGVLSMQCALGDSCHMQPDTDPSGQAWSYWKHCLLYTVLRRSVSSCQYWGTRENNQWHTGQHYLHYLTTLKPKLPKQAWYVALTAE